MQKHRLLRMLAPAIALISIHAHAQTQEPKSLADFAHTLEDIAQCRTSENGIGNEQGVHSLSEFAVNEQGRRNLEQLGIKIKVLIEGYSYDYTFSPDIQVFGHQASRAIYVGSDHASLQGIAFPAKPGLFKELVNRLHLTPIPKAEWARWSPTTYHRSIPTVRPDVNPFNFAIVADTQEMDGQSFVMVACDMTANWRAQ